MANIFDLYTQNILTFSAFDSPSTIYVLCTLTYFLFLLFVCSYSSALEHLRKKIEMSTEKIRLAKVKEEQAKKVGHLLAPCS
jgi:hypothetical protein